MSAPSSPIAEFPSHDAPIVEQTGAIVFRNDYAEPLVLLIESRDDPSRWIFPKGDVEPGEPIEAAALREVKAEAGVEGELLGPIGEPVQCRSTDEKVRVQYHLVRMTAERASPERRPKEWLTVERALEHLSFDEARALLQAALPHIERSAQREADSDFPQFLVAEYNHVVESFLRNEEDGEKRATFFLTLSAAVAAVLGFLLRERSGPGIAAQIILVESAILALLLLGFFSFARVVGRNVASDRYKRRLGRIRRYFVGSRTDPRLRYLPFDPYQVDSRRLPSWRAARGGWLEVVGAVEALFAGALVAIPIALLPFMALSVEQRRLLAVVAGLAAALIAWYWLVEHANARYRREMWEGADGFVLERGALGEGGRADQRRVEKWRREAAERIQRHGLVEQSMTAPANSKHPPHSHDAGEVVYLLGGEMTVTDVDSDQVVRLLPGDALFIPAGVTHRTDIGSAGADCMLGVQAAIPGESPERAVGASARLSSDTFQPT